MTAPELRLGLPKGRMQDGVLDLLREAGIQVKLSTRGYRPSVSLPGVGAKVLKPQNIIEMLHVGSRDLGFAGADWVHELGYDRDGKLVELMDTGLDPVRMVVAAPETVVENGKLPNRPLVVAAEMPETARKWIARTGIDATVVRTYGATEVFPPEDADAIVDITATGDTLQANKLVIVDEILRSSTRLYAHAHAMETAEKRQRIEEIVLLLESVLEARRRVMVDLNVEKSALDAVLEVLPCLRLPTISPLRDDGFAVRAAVPRADLPRLIPELKARGATDLVVTSPTQIVR
jgi:ATP phosphoribosyltransferase